MARDYAHRQASPAKRPAPKPSGGALPGWAWAVLGLSLGLAVAVAVFIIYRPVQGPAPAATPVPQLAPAKPQSPDIPPRQESRFKFYDLLPKYEVKPSEEPYKPEPQAVPDDTARYLLQAGSFAERADAERRKANLALLGFESSILTAEVNGRTRYRVQIGPPMNARSAEKAMRQLADNDIDSFATRSGG